MNFTNSNIPILQIKNISKQFENLTALQNISLDVYKGEMFGLIGPDGAGKTTLVKILCGLLKPDSGSIDLLNLSLQENKKILQSRIGYLSQDFTLYGDLSVEENLEFFAEIHNIQNYKNSVDYLLNFTRLNKFKNRPADKLSGGMKKKLALACSLIHNPELLLLDEPTTGVDPVSRKDFWQILNEIKLKGVTVFMTTPYLDEAERCNRVALIQKGNILTADSPEKIKNEINLKSIEIICENARDVHRILKKKFSNDVQLFGDRVNILTPFAEEDKLKIITHLQSLDIKILEARILEPSLENVFIHLIKK